MDKTRLDDMLERYGEVCTQEKAAKILGIVSRTVRTMMNDGRLKNVGSRVDVRSICEYIENPRKANFDAFSKKHRPDTMLPEGTFMRMARGGRWNK